MIHYSIESFANKLQKNRRLLAIDFGLRKTGIASTNTDLSLSSPYKTIITKSRNQLLIDLKKIMNELNPWGIIIGFPLLKDGTESAICEKIKIFAEQIIENFDKDILLFNETGTSKKAQEILMSMDFKRKRRDKLDDQLAACILLDNFLESYFRHET